MIRFESGQIGPSLASRQGFNISSTSAPDSVIRGEQNGTGNDWSGQDLSQEAEHVCLRRYPPAPNGTVIAPNWGKVQISTFTYGQGLGHHWPRVKLLRRGFLMVPDVVRLQVCEQLGRHITTRSMCRH